MALNKVFIIGNIGGEPEVKQTKGGNNVLKMSVAMSKKWKDRDGNTVEKTEWITVRCWRQLADFLGRYAHKGQMVFIEGELVTEEWEKDGQKRSQILVEANNVQLLGRKDDKPASGGSTKNSRREEWSAAPAPSESLEPQSDDLPF